MTLHDLKSLAATFQSVATGVSFAVIGIWVWLRFLRQQERYPNVEFSADVNFIGLQGEWWIVELVAILENKGKAHGGGRSVQSAGCGPARERDHCE